MYLQYATLPQQFNVLWLLMCRECNRRASVISAFNDLYHGLFVRFYSTWRYQFKTIADTGFVLAGSYISKLFFLSTRTNRFSCWNVCCSTSFVSDLRFDVFRLLYKKSIIWWAKQNARQRSSKTLQIFCTYLSSVVWKWKAESTSNEPRVSATIFQFEQHSVSLVARNWWASCLRRDLAKFGQWYLHY